MSPQLLNVQGGTQPEIYQRTVDAMVMELKTDASKFWQQSLALNGPIEIWDINGQRWLFNGNHRYQAALVAGVEIPDANIKIVDMTGSSISTWRFDQMTWLQGLK